MAPASSGAGRPPALWPFFTLWSVTTLLIVCFVAVCALASPVPVPPPLMLALCASGSVGAGTRVVGCVAARYYAAPAWVERLAFWPGCALVLAIAFLAGWIEPVPFPSP